MLLANAKAAVERASGPETPATWRDVVESVERATERLSRAWGVIGHLNAVADTPELRAAYAENLPRVTEFSASVGQNLALYEKYKAIAASERTSLAHGRTQEDPQQRPARFPPVGRGIAGRPEAALRANCRKNRRRFSKAFSDHVLDATNAYSYLVEDKAELAGLPEDVIEAAQEAAQNEGRNGWKFTLHFPSYFPVMQYSENRAMRETMYRAYVTRASELGGELRQRQGRVGQHCERRRAVEAACRRSAYARLSELR